MVNIYKKNLAFRYMFWLLLSVLATLVIYGLNTIAAKAIGTYFGSTLVGPILEELYKVLFTYTPIGGPIASAIFGIIEATVNICNRANWVNASLSIIFHPGLAFLYIAVKELEWKRFSSMMLNAYAIGVAIHSINNALVSMSWGIEFTPTGEIIIVSNMIIVAILWFIPFVLFLGFGYMWLKAR